jgi:phosphoribosylanthranilate isomerase
MWIKICGNTNLEDALHAAHSGANALGFVFSPSPRRVTVAQVRDIVPHLPPAIETYGVFVDASADEIVRTVVECGLTGVQLHRAPSGQDVNHDPQMPVKLRRRFQALHAGPIRIISVLPFDELTGNPLQHEEHGADALLVDSRTATAAGGTGIRFDWKAARESFHQAKGRSRVIAAGGLNPENVEEAIETLAPWGVDVVTGVESTPGRKDARRVEAFILSARKSDGAAA